MAERVLIVHAHPGDETVWTGATIARVVRDAGSVTVVTCTRGERGDVLAEDLRALGHSRADLAHLRSRELDEAMSILGVTDHRFLGESTARRAGAAPRRYLDSGLAWSVDGPTTPADVTADALTQADLGEVAADLAAVITDVQPSVVVSYGPGGMGGHPDRRRAHEAARWAASVMRVPFYELVEPGEFGSTSVTDLDCLEARTRALGAYRSQLAVREETFVFASGAPHRLDEPEVLRRHRATQGGFAGYGVITRVLACALAVIVGAFAGLVLTAAHQSVTEIGGVPVPWGVIVALVLSTALLAGLRIVYRTRIVAGAATVGLLGAITALTLFQGSSVLIPDNDAGRIWLIGVVLVAAVVLAWPQVESRRGGRMRTPSVKGSDQP